MHIKYFLQGNIVDLRVLLREDLNGEYINWLNDAEVCQYNSHHVYPYGPIQAEQYISSLENNKNNLVLAIIARDTSKHIGNISLQNIDYINRNAEYAIILGDKAYHGKGVAKEVSLLLLKHGFNSLNLHRIYCGTSSANIAMQRLAIALGMKEEGRRKQALYKNGLYYDVLEYGLLREDFKF